MREDWNSENIFYFTALMVMIFTFRKNQLIVYSPIRQYFLAQISHNVETREHVLRPNSITLSAARLSLETSCVISHLTLDRNHDLPAPKSHVFKIYNR